jgi:hypothetical protein
VWDGVPGKMVAQMMEKSGATLMSHWGRSDDGKV